MEPERDPEGIEIEFLKRTGVIHGRKVVEIGCGNGRLTWRYANYAASAVGVDPDSERLAEALTTRPETMETWSAFAQTEAETLPFPDEAFECAILAWSL
jgi:ubiquinone/menaquinone biosynthesis C-methylase UbiE